VFEMLLGKPVLVLIVHLETNDPSMNLTRHLHNPTLRRIEERVFVDDFLIRISALS